MPESYADDYPGGSPPWGQWLDYRPGVSDFPDLPTRNSEATMATSGPGVNMLAALSHAAQAEEARPGGGGGGRILGLHQRAISELQTRVSRIEATK